MRTRLRSHRRREDDLPESVRPSQPAASPAPPQNDLRALQRTIGNTAMRRYLHPDSASAASGLISRESAKEKAVENPALAAARGPVAYMTLVDDQGKLVQSASKRKGREGQFELVHFDMQRPKDVIIQDRDPNRSASGAGQVTVSSGGPIGFTLVKVSDASTPILSEIFARAKNVAMHIEVVSPEPNGKESPVMTIDLKDVSMTSLSQGSKKTGGNEVATDELQAQADGNSVVLASVAEKIQQIQAKQPAVQDTGRK